jgi:hypothetical protein
MGISLDPVVGIGGGGGDVQGILDSAGSIYNSITGALGAPTGTVDVVPYQNAIFNDVIVPISNIVNSANAPMLTTDELQQMLTALNTAHDAWENFIHNYPWATNTLRQRALAGEATLAPYWTLYQQRIQALMVNAPSGAGYTSGIPGIVPITLPGGTTPVGTTPPPSIGGILTAGFSSPIAVGLGILALYYFSKRRG